MHFHLLNFINIHYTFASIFVQDLTKVKSSKTERGPFGTDWKVNYLLFPQSAAVLIRFQSAFYDKKRRSI